MARQRTSEAARQEIAAMAKDGGLTVAQMSGETGVSVPRIYAMLNEMGIEPPRPNKIGSALTPEQQEELMQKWFANERPVDIASAYGFPTVAHLYAWLRSEGIDPAQTTQTRRKQRLEMLDLGVKLYEEGEPWHEIMARTGLSSTTITPELRRRGIKMRRG